MTADPKSDLKRPPSPTNLWINFTGLAMSIIALFVVREFGKELSNLQVGGICLISLAIPIILLELIFLKTYAKPSTGIDFSKKGDWNYKRVGIKLGGFYLTLGLIVLAYWTFPEYHGDFYQIYYELLRLLFPIVLIMAIPYFLIIDAYMRHPEDGYWQLGRILLGQWQAFDKGIVGQHLLGWLVKMFFLPLMFVYFTQNLDFLRSVHFAQIFSTYKEFHDFTNNSIFYIDLLFVTMGYMLTFRLLDSHIRSTEPSFLGWLVAIGCYQPFWSFFSQYYLAYEPGKFWGSWFWGNPVMYPLWSTLILLLLVVYAWASIAFGIRFSNLTNRGILTNGPYQLTKHPAYLSKNLSWWLISMPFLSTVSISEALRHSLLLVGLNIVYFLRARTEERHLSKDPAYVEYAEFIERHGMFFWVGKWLPLLKFKPNRLFNLPD